MAASINRKEMLSNTHHAMNRPSHIQKGLVSADLKNPSHATVERSDLAAAILLDSLISEAYADRGPGQISRLQWSLLRCLARTYPKEKTPTWLARFVGVSLSPVSRALNSLHNRGLIERCKCHVDSRQINIKLTEVGCETLKSDPLGALARSISKLPKEQRLNLKQSIQSISVRRTTGE